jgi:hypothetical protein
MKFFVLAALAVVGAAVASQLPEIQRYLKIRQM